MAKIKKRIAITENQRTIFDLLTQESANNTQNLVKEGSANVHDRLRLAVSNGLKHPVKSRWQIAGEMSHLLGTEISKFQLDGWVAESKEHRFPCEYLPAFCIVTGCYEPMQLLAEAAGMFVLPGSEALRAEIQKLDEQARKTQAEKRRRLMLLEELEKAR